jgi:hypothetical protein
MGKSFAVFGELALPEIVAFGFATAVVLWIYFAAPIAFLAVPAH